LAGVWGRGKHGRPKSSDSSRRQRGQRGGGARGACELPRGVLGVGWDGRRQLAGVEQVPTASLVGGGNGVRGGSWAQAGP